MTINDVCIVYESGPSETVRAPWIAARVRVHGQPTEVRPVAGSLVASWSDGISSTMHNPDADRPVAGLDVEPLHPPRLRATA